MKFVLLIATLLVLTSVTSAQEYEYGKREDLKGLTTFWVDTRSDLNARTAIVDAIKKELPDLELVEELVDADIRIQFEQNSEEQIRGATRVYNSTVIRRIDLITARGRVWLLAFGPDKRKVRLIISFEHEGYSDKKPLKKFVAEFVKAYKAANVP